MVAFDGDGQPLPGVTVTFAVTGGGGAVQGGTQVTDAQGIARVGGWILGISPGANTLEARSTGVPAAAFQATGVAATPATSTALGPLDWDGFLGNYLSGAPAIRVTDSKGDPVAAAAVTWQADGGGTVVQRGPAVTDFDGRATLSGWRLGGTASAQSARAAVAGLPDVVFTATAAPLPPPAFRIEVRFTGSQPTGPQRAAFEQAATR